MAVSAPGVASPCIKLCRMDEILGMCEGCYRTLDEIAGWSGYTNAEKLQVLKRVAERKRRMETGKWD